MPKDHMLDVPGADTTHQVPADKVTKIAGTTHIQLPYNIFARCIQDPNDGRTYTFCLPKGLGHEGEKVIIFSYYSHTKQSRKGILGCVDPHIPNKWFVQTPV